MRQRLQPAIQHYHELIASDLGRADEQLDQLFALQRERGVLFGDRPLAHGLRPTFLSEALYTEVQDVVYVIRQAVLKIAATFFNDGALLRDELGMSEWELELAALPTDVIRLSAIARMDSFLTEQSFKFVEINGETPAGLAYIHELGRIYRELPLFQTFERTYPVRFVSPLEHTLMALLLVYHEQHGGREEKPAFAIVDHLDVPTIHEFRLVKGHLERHGFPCEIVDPRALEVHDGWVVANGRRIDILYRRLLLRELFDMRDDCRAFIEGYRRGRTCYLNSFRSNLVHKKAIFAFLTDERYTRVLNPEQCAVLARHIPWTRRLREQRTVFRGLEIDLVEFVRANRRYFILKPNDAYGGEGVALGFSTSQTDWERAIQIGLERGFVVQETVNIHREPFLTRTPQGWQMVPTVIDLDPYLNGPLMGGCLTRTSATDLANVTAGGGTLPMFILRSV